MSNPNLGDIATCAVCARPVVYAGAGQWDHLSGADHAAAPMTGREQGAIDALRMMMDEARWQRDRRQRNAQRALRYRREAQRMNRAYLSATQSRARLRDAFRAARSKADTWMDSWLRAVGLAARNEEEIACLRTQLQDRESDLAFEYEARVKAEARVDALKAAIRTHRAETSAGCEVDKELWRHIE